MNNDDEIRVVRMVEYVGPRKLVTHQVHRSLAEGEHELGGIKIRVGMVSTLSDPVGRALEADEYGSDYAVSP